MFQRCPGSLGTSSTGWQSELYTRRAYSVNTTEKMKWVDTMNTMYRYFTWFHFRYRNA